MNRKNFWKTTISAALLISLMLPTASLANAETNRSPILAKAAADRKDDLLKYGQLAANYLVDCDDLQNQPRPSGERLKRCLTIAKELRDRFAEFVATLDAIIRNIKIGNKWTKELDEQFNNEAARRGIDAETASLVKQAGGVRAFLQENSNFLRNSKGELEREVKELETKIQKNASAQGDVFQTVSYEPAAAPPAQRFKKIIKVIKVLADVVVTVCTATTLCN